MPQALPQPCPCGLPAAYADCCGRWHTGPGQYQAPNAEALMRSRYSAYVLCLGNYLLATWHGSTRPAEPPAFQAGLRWLGLEVRRHQIQDDRHAVVEFVARSKWGGKAHRHRETSRFVFEAGRWYYLDGDVHGQD